MLDLGWSRTFFKPSEIVEYLFLNESIVVKLGMGKRDTCLWCQVRMASRITLHPGIHKPRSILMLGIPSSSQLLMLRATAGMGSAKSGNSNSSARDYLRSPKWVILLPSSPYSWNHTPFLLSCRVSPWTLALLVMLLCKQDHCQASKTKTVA